MANCEVTKSILQPFHQTQTSSLFVTYAKKPSRSCSATTLCEFVLAETSVDGSYSIVKITACQSNVTFFIKKITLCINCIGLLTLSKHECPILSPPSECSLSDHRWRTEDHANKLFKLCSLKQSRSGNVRYTDTHHHDIPIHSVTKSTSSCTGPEQCHWVQITSCRIF